MPCQNKVRVTVGTKIHCCINTANIPAKTSSVGEFKKIKPLKLCMKVAMPVKLPLLIALETEALCHSIVTGSESTRFPT